MKRKYKASSKSDMRRLGKDLNKAIRETALEKAKSQSFEVNCPHCNSLIEVQFGKQSCPNCGEEVNVVLNS